MKKIVVFLIVVLMLAGCGDNDLPGIILTDDSIISTPVDETFFLRGEVIELRDSTVLIDDETAGLVWVSLVDGYDEGLKVHSVVQILFDGMIAESYPGQTTGRQLEVLLSFDEDALYSYDEMNERIVDGDVNRIIAWNNTKDMVAYATVDLEALNDNYQVFIAGLYMKKNIEVAYVAGEVPDLNWLYDSLEIQTATGSYLLGPDFDEIMEVVFIGETVEVSKPASPTFQYEVVEKIYESDDAETVIEYLEVTGMKGELVQDYVNQSLYAVVDIFKDYDQVKIKVKILRQDDFLTIAYSGVNEAADYDIEKYLTIDMLTSTEVNVENTIVDQEEFAVYFEDESGFSLKELEGVSLYLTNTSVIFTFVPPDDSMERKYVEFELPEIAPMLNLTYEKPAS